jgi:cytochrome c oxidase cbb3-type subunit I
VVRGLGGAMFLSGALIMVFNLWMTVRAQPSQAAVPAGVPAE